MALNDLALSAVSGVQGRRFSATILGLTTGAVEVVNDGSPGFSTVNGRLHSSSLPYPTSTVVLKEYEPGVGQGFKISRIDISAATSGQLLAQAKAALAPGRTLGTVTLGSNADVDGSLVYSLYVSDDLGATTVVPVDPSGSEGRLTLETAAFSKTLQIGVALSGVTVLGTQPGADVVSNYPGVTIDDSTYPPTASGTPTVDVVVSDAIIETFPGAIGSPKQSPAKALEGAPVFTVNPTLSGTMQVGQTVVGTSGTAPGATSYAFQYFRRAGGSGGNGTSIAGAFNLSRVIPEADATYEYRLRVRAFRGSLFAEFYTPWTSAIASASVGIPTFTGASSFSGSAGVGETLTAVPGTGTGVVSVQWVADDVEIAGATSLTYVQAWSDRYKAIKPVIVRSNASGSVADTTVLTPIVCTPKLTAAYHNNPSWYDGSTERWMTPVLCTPYEPGKGGTSKVSSSFSARTRSFDQRVDFYYHGNLHWANPGTPIGAVLNNSGGRNGVYIAFETDGWKVQHLSANGRVSLVGVKGAVTAPPQDQLFYGGSETSSSPGNQSTDIQGCYLPTRGTYANPYIVAGNFASGLNEAPIKSIARLNSTDVKIIIDTAAFPAGFRVPLPKGSDGKYKGYLMIYGVQVSSGVTNGLNVDWATNYEVVSYNAPTGEIIAVPTFIGDGNSSAFTPTVGQSGVVNTGKCVVLAYSPDNHSDGGQKTKGPGGPTRRHGNTYEGNYTAWGVDGNALPADNVIIRSCENVRRYFGYNPQEYRAPLVYMGLSTGSTYLHESTNCYIEGTWPGVSFGQLVFPGTPQGSVITTLPNGNQFMAHGGSNYANWRGGDELGVPPGGDFAPPASNYWNWSKPFHGQRNPVNADMIGISISKNTIAPGSAVGAEIGQLILAHNWTEGLNDAAGRVVIYDYVITGVDTAKVTQGWSGLLYTAVQINAPITLQVTALIRDSAANYGAPVQFGPVPITITPG